MYLGERLRDTIPVNQPYAGLVAEAYDLWFPPDAPYPDDAYYRRRIEDVGGTALELGCGTGRLLLRYRAAGLAVEGVDSSPDMLAICRRHADDLGLDLALHEGDMAALDLGRRYDLLYCPAGTFTLLDDADRAAAALRGWREHLVPGGLLLVSLFVPESDFDANYEWRVRRSATRPSDGTTVMVQEAVHCLRDERLHDVLNRIEVWEPNGRLAESWLRRMRLRWWSRDEFEQLLGETGFVGVHSQGGHDEWIAAGHATS